MTGTAGGPGNSCRCGQAGSTRGVLEALPEAAGPGLGVRPQLLARKHCHAGQPLAGSKDFVPPPGGHPGAVEGPLEWPSPR